MSILITGATGLVGSALLESLSINGFSNIKILTRNKKLARDRIPFPVEIFEWNPNAMTIEKGALLDVNTVIHLAGENVSGGRWSKSRKEKILNSRINSTKLLIDEIKKLERPPKKFICSSAVGIYGNRGEESLSENSPLGAGFLADLCKKWENLALNHDIPAMTSHCLRTGVVLSTKGGALPKMLPAFKLGVGGRLGKGDQYMSWIHIDDLVGQIIYLIRNDCSQSIYNAVSPRPVPNYIFTTILGNELKRPTIFPVPKIALKILFGEMSEILLDGQKVIPTQFMEAGYEFKFRSLKDALQDLLQYNKNGEEILLKYQWIKKPPQDIFNFFSDEMNLEKITPDYLHFKVLGKSTDKIEEGTIIDYKLSLRGLPFKWQSKIDSYIVNDSFTDTQIKGPYSKWIHYHGFIPLGEGTLIKDKVIYKVPMGCLGRLVAGSFVKSDLRKVFNFRRDAINHLFQ